MSYQINIFLSLVIVILTFLLTFLHVRAKQKYIDPLTKSYNRYYITNKALKSRKKHTVVTIDYDDFKMINDTYGHLVGDLVLINLSEQFMMRFKHLDGKFIRLGGDEFALLLDHAVDIDELIKIIEEIKKTYFVYEHIKFKYTISCGLMNYSDKSLDTILDLADFALYKSKRLEKNTITIFTEEMLNEINQSNIINSSIDDLLCNPEQLKLYVQPVMAMIKDDVKVAAVEVLARWEHPTLGLLQPGQFLNNIKRENKGCEFDLLVIKSTLEVTYNLIPAPLRISINITPATIASSKGLWEYLEDIVKTNKIDPHRIFFEITEDILIPSNYKKVDKFINKLIDLGFTFALDDFGSNGSSFFRIAEFNLSIIKYECEFSNLLLTNYKMRKIFKYLVELNGQMGIRSVLEGIETKEQFELAKEYNVTYFQGYYFYKPMTVEEFKNVSNVITQDDFIYLLKKVAAQYNIELKVLKQLENK